MLSNSIHQSVLRPQVRTLTDVNYKYSVASDQALAQDDEVVAGEVYNALSTLVGDEPGDPTFGSDLPLYVYEPYSERLEQVIFSDVYFALANSVPQVKMDMAQSYLLISESDRMVGISLHIIFDGRALNVDFNLTGRR